MMDDEIAVRMAELSPEAQALFIEVGRQGEEWEYSAPPDELIVDLRQRVAELSPQDRREFLDLFRAIARHSDEERTHLEAEALQAEGFAKLIERAQELDRQAGRPVTEDMTLGEALARLEEGGYQ
jgi:hypothetical protein